MEPHASSGAPGTIRTIRQGRAATVVMDRPDKRNALTLAMFAALTETLRALGADDGVTHVILTGAGIRAFTSGGDLDEFTASRADAAGTAAYRAVVRGTVETVAAMAKPVIAAIRGHCVGGGLSLALACDMRFATPDARFMLPSARFGSGFDYPSIARLTTLVGPALANELFFTALPIDGRRAAEIGLVNRCIAADTFAAEIEQLAQTLAGNALNSIIALKQAIRAAAAAPGQLVAPDAVRDALDRCRPPSVSVSPLRRD